MTPQQLNTEYQRRLQAMLAAGHIDINALDAMDDWRGLADLQFDYEREREQRGVQERRLEAL